jgi:hypothetical protein
MRHPSISLRLLVFSTLLVACNGPSDGRHAIKGQVLFQGKPLDQGLIEFHPVNGPPGPAAGGMIRAGRFAIPREQGLPVGVYKVVIRSAEPVPLYTLPPMTLASNRERIAARYNDYTELTAEVTPRSGTCSFEFKVD